tara:strand:+ start:994 stop:2109 length:1116 start_codon:yes stop_codon:yes gene_type:complete
MNFFKNIKKEKFLIIFILFSFAYIFISNTYFSFDQSLIYGAADGNSYMQISKDFPYFNKNNLSYIHNERFIIPYLIGLLSYSLNLDHFLIYRILIFLLIIFTIFIFYKIISFFKIDHFNKFIIVGLIIFNPYIVRYFLSLPTLINDLVFMASSLLIIHGFLTKKKLVCFIGFAISIAARQTGLVFLPAIIINKIIYKKKSFFSLKDIIFITLIYLIIYILNTYHANIAGSEHNLKNNIVGIFSYFPIQNGAKELLYFLLFPLLSFGPLIFYTLFRKFNKKLISELNLIIIISSMLIVLQPILAGPIYADKNIIRLTTLCFPIILILILSISSFNYKSLNKSLYLFIYLFFLIWSSHPTYSMTNEIIDFLLN